MTIDELEDWYRTAPAPEMPVYLNEAIKVTDYPLFVSAHFEGLRAAPNDFIKAPLIKRLLEMKLIIEAGS
ncbi:DUF6965 family protein [Pedobacter ureilyticus]|uniref:DUF6965 family protein n=1 Tax=Pedobacter ureilyticus TaxID=1393051 RepID=A0ABW9J1W6_9SPHI|nr:hypothetical protein [Pedobacter helvus]